MVTASNDWTVRLFDLRCMPTGDAVTAAPVKGRKGACSLLASLSVWLLVCSSCPVAGPHSAVNK